MAPKKEPSKLDWAQRRNSGDGRREALDFSEIPKGVLHFEEVDFSFNGLTSHELPQVLEVCMRCPRLRVLKLFKNSIDDSGALGLAELCRYCPTLEEIHLSHNMFTASGASSIITAAESSRREDQVPLWLRLEQNHIEDAEAVFKRLQAEHSVCRRIDPKACTARVCARKCRVHLPHFCLQRLNAVESNQDMPARRDSPNLPRQMLRQFRDDLDRQKGKSKGKAGKSEAAHVAAKEASAPKPRESRKPQVQVHQLLDVEGSQEFVCYLCRGVVHYPTLTRCSHLFCSPCFQSWVVEKVSEHSSGPEATESMQAMPCPVCDKALKKADVVPLHRAKHPAAAVMQRRWQAIRIKCAFHPELADFGETCDWQGDLPQYAAHCKVCPVGSKMRPSSRAMSMPVPTKGNGDRSAFSEDDVCVVKYDFEGEDPKMLRVAAHDIVKIYRTVPSGWAGGILLDKSMEEVGLPGWLPINYLELYQS